MIKYLGSKRRLLPALRDTVQSLDDVQTVIDLFSGTSRVGHALKEAGYRVIANDHNDYAHTLATCYVQADRDLSLSAVERLLKELADTPAESGWFTETYCVESRFFQAKNGAKIEAIRGRIDEMGLDPLLRSIALVSLMEAADRVDSTTGVQMAYLKKWAPRAHKDLELRVPNFLPGSGLAICSDANQLLDRYEADLVYIDPPYNQHGYLRNYHIWETLIRWDQPEVYGVARKRMDCKTRKSPFNSKRAIHEAFRQVIARVKAKHALISFNNEGYISHDEIVEILEERGPVKVQEIEYSRYVGAKIGVYNPSGKKVGKVSHTKNIEYLFHVDLRS